MAADELADQVWDGAPPAGAAATLPSYVMRLRRALGPDAGRRLLTRAPGYLIEILDDSELDLRRFTALRRQADEAAAARDWQGAAAGLRAALGLWRGSALEDVPEVYLKAQEVPALRAGWIRVHEDLARADLELGRPGDVAERVARLRPWFPYREELSGLLMQAQVSAGRPAEALEEYAQLRRTLVSELGVEPGPQIQALQAAVLAGGALPSWPRAEPPTQPAAWAAEASMAEDRVAARPTPRQLPGAVRHFVGRSAEMRTLTDLAASAATGKTVIAAISGMAGSGKTAMAVHWGTAGGSALPGRAALGQPARLRSLGDTGDARARPMRAFLDALGVTAGQLPVGLEAQGSALPQPAGSRQAAARAA